MNDHSAEGLKSILIGLIKDASAFRYDCEISLCICAHFHSQEVLGSQVQTILFIR
jgi:hypothetical protein